MFEGGVRGVSWLTGGFLPNKTFGSTRTGLLQHVDIPQTIAALAGTTIPGSDGYNVWNYIISDGESPRSEVPVNIDTCVGKGFGGPPCTSSTSSALIMGNWKLISVSKYPGPNVAYDGWWSNDPYTKRAPNATQGPVTIDGVHTFLFDLSKDECENENVALANPGIVAKLQARMVELADPKKGYRDPQFNIPHPRAFPIFHNGTWAPWRIVDEDNFAEFLV